MGHPDFMELMDQYLKVMQQERQRRGRQGTPMRKYRRPPAHVEHRGRVTVRLDD